MHSMKPITPNIVVFLFLFFKINFLIQGTEDELMNLCICAIVLGLGSQQIAIMYLLLTFLKWMALHDTR